MKRGDNWNPNAPQFIDAMKQHPAFVKQMTEQGKMAIAGLFPLSDRGGESPFFAWGQSRLPS
jgi:hypothetical protein